MSASAVLAIVPYFVARFYVSRRVEAKLPIADGRLARIRRFVRAAQVALVIAPGRLAAVFGAGAVGLVALALGVVGYVVIVYLGDQMWVGARPSRRPDVLVLTRVHPGFARALGEAHFYEERNASGRGETLPSDY